MHGILSEGIGVCNHTQVKGKEEVFRPIWINTYVRGNINTPLHNKDRINVVIK